MSTSMRLRLRLSVRNQSYSLLVSGRPIGVRAHTQPQPQPHGCRDTLSTYCQSVSQYQSLIYLVCSAVKRKRDHPDRLVNHFKRKRDHPDFLVNLNHLLEKRRTMSEEKKGKAKKRIFKYNGNWEKEAWAHGNYLTLAYKK